MDLDGLKGELKSVYAEDFTKQASSIQKVTEIIQELEVNQILALITKLQRLILTTPATSVSSERLSSSLKRLNYDMWCSRREERLSYLVLISMNKDLLKKIKVEHGVDTFYNKRNDEFA